MLWGNSQTHMSCPLDICPTHITIQNHTPQKYILNTYSYRFIVGNAHRERVPGSFLNDVEQLLGRCTDCSPRVCASQQAVHQCRHFRLKGLRIITFIRNYYNLIGKRVLINYTLTIIIHPMAYCQLP